MRLIDADSLFNKLGDIWNIPKDWDGDIDETCETAFDVIENAPTVEVKPVVYGEWIESDWFEYDGRDECILHPKEAVKCTNCNHAFKKDLLWRDNFCPNCGAMMSDMRKKVE